MYSTEEDVINSATHFLSAIASILFTCLILFTIELSGKELFPIFLMGSTSAWTFFSSYLYHSTRSEPLRERNRLLDRSSIYIMIAGNGGAIALLSSHSLSSTICCLLLILCGSLLTLNLCIGGKITETFSLSSYLLMGWLAVIPSSGIFGASKFTSTAPLLCLLVGGLAYSSGVVFYISDKKWYHAAWHVFTMVGFSFHFAAAYLCL